MEIFDPRTGQTRTAGDLKVAREEHTATLLPDGTVLLVGDPGSAANSAEIYEPTSVHSTLVGPLTEPRSDHVAVLLENGKVLILGGDTSRVGATPTAGAELYDPVHTHIHAHWAYEHAAGPLWRRPPARWTYSRRRGHHDGKTSLASAEIYDPDTGQFISTGTLLTARRKHAGALLSRWHCSHHGRHHRSQRLGCSAQYRVL